MLKFKKQIIKFLISINKTIATSKIPIFLKKNFNRKIRRLITIINVPTLLSLRKKYNIQNAQNQNSKLFSSMMEEFGLTNLSKLNHYINQKIKNKEPLGQGVEGVVFEISSDWLIKIPKLLYYVCNWSRPLFFKKSYASLLLLADSGFIALEDEFEGRNFGQKIALNPYNISIMKRVRGEPVRLTNDFSHQGAQDYLNLIREISNLPEEAFEEYFKDINILCNKGYSIDYNPHNLLFDREEKRLNVIDFIKSQESSSNSQMIAAIVDFDYMPLYYQFLNIDEKKELLYLLKIIYDRITKIKGNIDGYIKNVNKIPKWIMHPLVLIAEFPELIDINEADIVTAVQKVQDEHNKIDDEIRNAELNRLIEYNKKFKPEKRI